MVQATGFRSHEHHRLQLTHLDFPLARCGYAAKGVVYLIIGWLALKVAFGEGGSLEGSSDALAMVRSQPFGQGLLFIIAGIFQWVKALKEKYKAKFTLDSYAASKRAWINRLAKLGLIARGVVFPIIGFFLMKAAIQSDPSEAKGLGDALRELASGTAGQLLLGIVTLGLACYGIYCWVLTIYGNFGRSTARA